MLYCPYFIVVDELFEVLIDLILPHIEMDAGKSFIIFVQRDHASDHALEVLGILVSDGLIGVDGRKDIVQGLAMISCEDHQIVDVARFHAVIDDDAFHDKKPIDAQDIKASLGNHHFGG